MTERLRQILKRYWGYDDFRPLQLETIESVCAGRDTLVLMPTGGGKSVIYQVPGLALDGVCIVVTPLIALMKDQIDQLRRRRILAESIHSGMQPRDIDRILDNCVYGDVKFLYIAPERIDSELFRTRFAKMRVSLLAVDEAHCISQWGYDFRPSYLRIARLRELQPEIPVLALTASGNAGSGRRHHATTEIQRTARPADEFRAQQPLLRSAQHRRQTRAPAAHPEQRSGNGHRLRTHPRKDGNHRRIPERKRHNGRILPRRHGIPDADSAAGRLDTGTAAGHGRYQCVRYGHRQGGRPDRRALRPVRFVGSLLPGSRTGRTGR